MKPIPRFKRRPESIYVIEAAGFLFIILLSWGVAYFDAPRYIFGDPPTFNWQRAILRTAVILPIWAWVHFTTRALLKRLRYLEEFLHVCAWCRKVGHQDQWLTMEEAPSSTRKLPTGSAPLVRNRCWRKRTGKKFERGYLLA